MIYYGTFLKFKNFSDDGLIAHVEKIAHNDRARLVEFMYCLREIEIRRLFSARKFPSIYAFLTDHLKYSNGEALLRIDTMRVMRDNPEVEAMLLEGSINMSNLALARLLFRKEEKAGRAIDKGEVIRKLQNVSARMAKKILADINPEILQFDHIVPVAAGGKTVFENLRLLCRNCNLRAAVVFYGREKMASHLSDIRRPYGSGPPPAFNPCP